MKLPTLYLLENNQRPPRVADVATEIRRGLESLELAHRIAPGDTVAITAGSRGVTDMVAIIRATAAFFKSLGANPFVTPAMGSHGGATAEGQARLLAALGINEVSVGAPIRSSMAVENIGRNHFGQPVFSGVDFCIADHVVVINRVKPHTSFQGAVESGLHKMLAIGMGKHTGAATAHRQFFQHGFEQVIQEIASRVLETLPILCGIALVENHLGQTACVAVVTPKDFWETEIRLIRRARELTAKVPFAGVDLLIVDEMGKNISGGGMDANVTGRFMNAAVPETGQRRFTRIYVRDLTPQSQGNALGVGAADFAAKRLVDKIDPAKTRINCITGMVPEKGRIPLTYDSDRPAITDALATVGAYDPAQARIVWIRNTSALTRMWISQGLLTEARQLAGFEIGQGPVDFPFDAQGDLPFLKAFC